MPFTVFARPRPIRTAFLLADATGFDAVCDGLVTWSIEAWGGRGSTIALLEKDGTLAEDTWQELVCFDPDQVCPLGPLTDELLGKLHEELGPWFIAKSEQAGCDDEGEPAPSRQVDQGIPDPADWQEESIGMPGVAVPPTEQNLGTLDKRRLLLFDFGKDCPAVLRRFLHLNLGTYYQWPDPRTGEARRNAWMEDLLPRIPVERVRVDDVASLCAAMERIAGKPLGLEGKRPLSCTAPCELSAIHLPRPFSRGALDNAYRVVVGSELRDFALYWRSCVNEKVWHAPFRYCLWVPAELIREEAFIAALKNWLYYFTGQGSSGSRKVELTSASLPSEVLSPLAEAWRGGTFRVPTRLAAAADVESRWRAERARREDTPRQVPLLDGNNADQLDAVERTQTWELRPPKVIQAEVPSGTWALDVQIGREPREGTLPGQDWWFLPRRSGRALVASMFRTPARISRSGLFSVRVERASIWPDAQTRPRLELRLPADDEVVRGLILRPQAPWFEYSDARRERLQQKPVVTGMAISDAGCKLRALIGLFGGFWRARDYWDRKFWRELFCRMAGRGADYDTDFRTQSENVIQKELKRLIPRVPDEERKAAATRITQRVLGLVGERLPGAPMTFAEMEEERKRFENPTEDEQQAKAAREVRYLAGDAVVHMMDVRPVSCEHLKEGLKELVGLGVLRMGVEVPCPRCRLKAWVRADDIRQADACPGCGSPIPLVPETAWSYRLNPLIHHCVNHRDFAVWQAVSELSRRLGSFFFMPSSNLQFAQPIDGDTEKELDVLCVTGGELLLGEVKEGELHETDFLKFAATAKVLRPDQAWMFVSEEHYEPNKAKVDKWLDGFKQRLAPGVRCELFCLPAY